MKPGPEFFACNKYKEMQDHPPKTTSTECIPIQIGTYEIDDIQFPQFYMMCNNVEKVDTAAMERARRDCENEKKFTR